MLQHETSQDDVKEVSENFEEFNGVGEGQDMAQKESSPEIYLQKNISIFNESQFTEEVQSMTDEQLYEEWKSLKKGLTKVTTFFFCCFYQRILIPNKNFAKKKFFCF